MFRRYSLPRPLHPFAWWGYAIALAVAASTTLNPLLLAAITAVACLVAFSRRGDNPWAKGFKLYLMLGVFIIVFRVVFRIIFGGGDGPTILFTLPEIPLPEWVRGIRLLGAVSLESLLYGLYDGMRLATMIICIGAANSLANPKRLLAALPAALYELGTILIVSFSVFPQLGDSFTRVMRARKLRKTQQAKTRKQRLGIIETIIVPVFSDALDRSVSLAASMEVRGYGRGGQASSAERVQSTVAGLAAIASLTVWAYFLLAKPGIGPSIGRINLLELALLLAGIGLLILAMRIVGRHVQRTRYRRDRWRLAETLTLLSGLALVTAVQLIAAYGNAGVLFPSISPFTWPELNLPLLGAVVVAALPAFLTPPPALSTSRYTKEGLS